MSLFANHIRASRDAGRNAVKFRNEADPLDGVTEEETVEGGNPDEAEAPVDETPVDEFAEQRRRLNAELGLPEDTVDEDTVSDEAAINGEEEETPSEESETPSVADGEVIEETPAVEEEVVETPAEDVSEDVVEETPAETDDAAIVGEGDEAPAEDTPSEETPVDDVPAGDETEGEDTEVVTEPEGEVEFTGEDDGATEEEEEAVADDVDDIESDVADLDEIETEMTQLAGAMSAVSAFGMNPTALQIMQTTGLLSGTALESLGLESMGFHSSKAAESQMALEALGEKMKEKSAAFAAKIVSLASGASSKIMGVLSPIWAKVSGAAKALGTATWDKAKLVGKTVKAHPYKTIIVVVGAIAAVAGILAYTGTNLPVKGVKLPQFTAFLKSLQTKINAIKWPFGDIKATVSENGTKIYASVKSAGGTAKAVAADKLGWTKSMVSAASGQLSRAWNGISTGAKAFGGRAIKVAGKAAEWTFVSSGTAVAAAGAVGSAMGSNVAGGFTLAAFAIGIATVISSVIRIAISIVAIGLRVIAGTFRALGSALGVTSAA